MSIRLKEKYQNEIVPVLEKNLGIQNIMEVPRVEKVVLNIGLGEAMDNPKVLDTPETKIFINNLGDSSVDFVVRPWVKSEDYWTVFAEVLENAKTELEAAGCSIPFPQRDVHVHQATP